MTENDTTTDDIDQMLLELQQEWRRVYVSYKGPEYYDGMECVIRNTTDEGLPTGTERKRVEASTFSQALQKAHDRYVDTGIDHPDCTENRTEGR